MLLLELAQTCGTMCRRVFCGMQNFFSMQATQTLRGFSQPPCRTSSCQSSRYKFLFVCEGPPWRKLFSALHLQHLESHEKIVFCFNCRQNYTRKFTKQHILWSNGTSPVLQRRADIASGTAEQCSCGWVQRLCPNQIVGKIVFSQGFQVMLPNFHNNHEMTELTASAFCPRVKTM